MKFIRTLFFKILYKLGAACFLIRRNRKRSMVPVLVFHKIVPEYDQIWPGIHPRLFDEMIMLIKKHYTIMPLHYLYSKPDMDLRNACFITFDDGYKDYLDYAYPILKKHSAHSTLFVLPYDLSNHGHIWTSTIIYFIKHYWFSEVRDFFLSHKQNIDFKDRFDDFSVNLSITKHFCTLQQSERQAIIKTLQKKFVDDNRVIEKELLNFDELRKLDPEYVSVASHSLTHPSFQHETDEEFLNHEIYESKKIIGSQLNIEVSSFAFPFGIYNTLAFNIVKKFYKLSFTGMNEPVDLVKLKKDNEYMYSLSRFNIHHDSAEEVVFLISGFHNKLRRFF